MKRNILDQYSRLYDEATKTAIDYVVNRFFNDSPGQLALNVISNEKISAADLKELKKLLDGKK